MKDEVSLIPKMLINDAKTGEDNTEITWYPLPFVKVKVTEESTAKEYNGTFKHIKCTGKVKEGSTCVWCREIPNLPSFKKRLLLRSNRSTDGVRNTNNIRFDYMTKQEQLEVIRSKTDKLEKSRAEMFFLRSKNVRLKLRSRTLNIELVTQSFPVLSNGLT